MVYGFSTVLGRLLNFFLLPFYTHVLRPGELGVVAIVLTYVGFFNVLFLYGMDQAYLRFTAGADQQTKKENFSTAMWSILMSSIALAAIVSAVGIPMAPSLGYGRYPHLALYAAVLLALDAAAVVPFAELRLSHKAWAYAGIKTVNIVVNVGLNIAFLWGMHLGVRGIFMAYLAASATTLLLLSPLMLRLCGSPSVFRRDRWSELLRFGLPFVPAGLASMAVHLVDRPILLKFTDEATVGIYQANYKLGIFMMLIVNMFDAAWRSFFLERADKPGSRELFGRVLTYFLVGGSFFVLLLSLFIRELVRMPVLGRPLIHPDYWSGVPIVPVVLTGYLLNGVYVNFIAQATLSNRTDLLVRATALGAAVNLGANLLLVPLLGMMGSAWAALLAFATMAASLYALGQKLYPIPYEFDRILHLACVLAAVIFGLYAAHSVLPDGKVWVLARLLGIFAYPALLWATGFLKPEERRVLSLG